METRKEDRSVKGQNAPLLPKGYKLKLICIIGLIDALLCLKVSVLNDVDMKCAVELFASQENLTTIPEQAKVLIHKSTITRAGAPSIMKVLPRLGYVTGSSEDHDLLWTRLYPLDPVVKKQFPELKKDVNVENMPERSKVNHFPGMSFLRDKRLLATSKNNRYIPKSFQMPKEKADFLDLIEKKPRYANRLWIEKGRYNKTKGSNIAKNHKDLNLDDPIVVQEFISNQLLIYNHSFKIGVNVLLTSVDPLRYYMIPNELHDRLSPETFSLDDLNATKKYLTDGHRTANMLYNLPQFKRHFDIKYNKGQILASYLEDEGYNISMIHSQIHNAIRSIMGSRRDVLYQEIRSFYGPTSRVGSNFFEIIRWDFIVSANTQVYLMEVNFPRDMISRGPDPLTIRNEMYVYDTLRLIGADKIGGHATQRSGLRNSDILVTAAAACYEPTCESCKTEECQLCSHCLGEAHVAMLKDSLGEQLNSQRMRRIFPKPSVDAGARRREVDPRVEYIPRRERINRAWFEEKCKQDDNYC